MKKTPVKRTRKPAAPQRPFFEFFDGKRNRKVDGVRLMTELKVQFKDLEFHLAMLEKQPIQGEGELKALAEFEEKAKLESMLKVTEEFRKLFGIEQFHDHEDGTTSGLMEHEVVALVYEFGEWVADLKKNIGSFPN